MAFLKEYEEVFVALTLLGVVLLVYLQAKDRKWVSVTIDPMTGYNTQRFNTLLDHTGARNGNGVENMGSEPPVFWVAGDYQAVYDNAAKSVAADDLTSAFPLDAGANMNTGASAAVVTAPVNREGYLGGNRHNMEAMTGMKLNPY